jgi:hypothetical protein
MLKAVRFATIANVLGTARLLKLGVLSKQREAAHNNKRSGLMTLKIYVVVRTDDPITFLT